MNCNLCGSPVNDFIVSWIIFIGTSILRQTAMAAEIFWILWFPKSNLSAVGKSSCVLCRKYP